MTKFGDYSTQSTIASSDTILFLDQNDASTGKLNQIEWGQLAGQISAGTELNVSHYLTPGQPDGTTNNSTEFQAAIDALPAGGGILNVPWNANRYLVNIDIPAYVTVQGSAYHNTVLRPYTDANPCVVFSGVRGRLLSMELEGNGVGVSAYGIRSERAVDGTAGGNVVQGVKISDFTYAMYWNNNYYNVFKEIRILDCTYGLLGRNAFNDNRIVDWKLTKFDYGIAIIQEHTDDGGADTYNSHSNYFQNITMESPNDREAAETADGKPAVGIWLKNVSGNTFESPYFEGFNSAHAWPVIEAHGPVTGNHGSGDQAYLVDEAGRDFTQLGVSTGMTLENITDGSTTVITAIGDEDHKNDKVTGVLTGGSDDSWDDEDYFLVDCDSELTNGSKLRNSFNFPQFSNQPDANRFVAGYNQIVSDLQGIWVGQKDGDFKFNKTTAFVYTANTRKEINVASNLSGYAGFYIGKLRITYKAIIYSEGAGYLTFRPPGGGTNQAQPYIDFNGATRIFGNAVHDGGDNQTFAQDATYNFVYEGVIVGDYVWNVTDDTHAKITAIGNGGGTNDKLTCDTDIDTLDMDDGEIFCVLRPNVVSDYVEIELTDNAIFHFMATQGCVLSLRIHKALVGS